MENIPKLTDNACSWERSPFVRAGLCVCPILLTCIRITRFWRDVHELLGLSVFVALVAGFEYPLLLGMIDDWSGVIASLALLRGNVTTHQFSNS